MRRGRKPSLSPEFIREVREWRAARAVLGRRVPPSRKELAAKGGIAPATVTGIAMGRNYRWVQ